MVDRQFDLYGQEENYRRDAVVLDLTESSIRSLARYLGRRPVARLAEWFDADKARTTGGRPITLVHRTRRLWRK